MAYKTNKYTIEQKHICKKKLINIIKNNPEFKKLKNGLY